MKNLIFILVVAELLLLSGSSYAQSGTNKLSAAEQPTAANVLKWTKEVLPKMELLVPKLEKIKANVVRDKRRLRQLRKMGWHVYTIWGCDLEPKKRVNTLLKLINRILRNG